MAAKFVFEEDVLRLICGYTRQSERSLEDSDFIMSRKASGL